jgi:hypothetical protein
VTLVHLNQKERRKSGLFLLFFLDILIYTLSSQFCKLLILLSLQKHILGTLKVSLNKRVILTPRVRPSPAALLACVEVGLRMATEE